ncbi:MAG: hypothetical protein OEW15_06005 [Nitrospirota bacterium]|nr:hypothetical protein [Nitrospirota bacterium]
MERERGNDDSERDELARRVRSIEERLDSLEERGQGGVMAHPAWPLATGLTAVVFAYLGMAVPRHPYQYLFAALLLALSYHRGFLLLFTGKWRWTLAATNFVNLSYFFMIILGGGVRHPLFWLKAPAVIKQPAPDGTSWYGRMVPDYSLQWSDIAGLSDWSIDVTKVQAFLLIATLAGALFRFPGFTSLAATALLIVSIPAYLAFTWDWVMLFLILASIALYLQSQPALPRYRYRDGPGRWS